MTEPDDVDADVRDSLAAALTGHDDAGPGFFNGRGCRCGWTGRSYDLHLADILMPTVRAIAEELRAEAEGDTP